ncbi:hypothetical protein K439DRAFT_1643329 [Ramaria rubella]|nr:hypothetical protein K439DRAFT_1643502 [Ramaria rubella]KAF8572927.1 hypothetical protein K439DRAFT_1643329 [Ramaria rubella]
MPQTQGHPAARFLPYSDLPPNLYAHKHVFVSTLMLAACATLVLSPRSWRLSTTKERPLSKFAP